MPALRSLKRFWAQRPMTLTCLHWNTRWYALREHHLHAATAESCTGGMIAERLTNVPGSSEVFGFGFVTYAEAAKQKLLGGRRRD